jgi:putative ABC transport system ATP-binding protein
MIRNNMLNIKNISYSYINKKVLDNLSCELKDKENLVIIGKSGSGKTTLLHLIAGLLKAQNGELDFNGLNLKTLNEKQLDDFRAKNVGLIFQQFHLINALTAFENVKLANDNISDDEVNVLFDKLDIAEVKNKRPSQLSIGQKQRVAVARALANKPKLIIADEPTSNLDDDNANKTIELLVKYTAESGAQLVIATHDSRIKSKFKNMLEL